MKRKILFGISLILLVVFMLSGCGKKPVVERLVVSAPDKVVFETDTVDLKGMKVYRIYNNGAIQEIEISRPDVIQKTPKEGGNAGIHKVIIRDPGAKDPENKKEFLSTSFDIVIKDSATEEFSKKYEFLAFKFEPKEVKKNPNLFAFAHVRGYGFEYEHFNERVKVIKVSVGSDGKVGQSLVENVPESAITTTLNDVNIGHNNVGYKPGTYEVKLLLDGIEGKFDVTVGGGERPIHAKSASWFDYILVIPIGWVMQLFAFGGNFGVGILFTTIVVRTLAWPIYAKSNDMSARMQEAQPELARIQAKYRGRTDKEGQRAMQMETMQVYKKHKVGFSSFLLPFLQMPIFIGMYQTVRRILIPGGYWAAKISGHTFMGIDLTIGKHWTSYLLAAIVGLTMGLLQYLATRKPKDMKKTAEHATQQDPKAKSTANTMKIISVVMIVMMVFFALQSNALALYWIFGNIFSIGQTSLHKYLQKRKREKKERESLGGIL